MESVGKSKVNDMKKKKKMMMMMRRREWAPCDLKYSEYTPCEDTENSLRYERERLVYRERHCPKADSEDSEDSEGSEEGASSRRLVLVIAISNLKVLPVLEYNVIHVHELEPSRVGGERDEVGAREAPMELDDIRIIIRTMINGTTFLVIVLLLGVGIGTCVDPIFISMIPLVLVILDLFIGVVKHLVLVIGFVGWYHATYIVIVFIVSSPSEVEELLLELLV